MAEPTIAPHRWFQGLAARRGGTALRFNGVDQYCTGSNTLAISTTFSAFVYYHHDGLAFGDDERVFIKGFTTSSDRMLLYRLIDEAEFWHSSPAGNQRIEVDVPTRTDAWIADVLRLNCGSGASSIRRSEDGAAFVQLTENTTVAPPASLTDPSQPLVIGARFTSGAYQNFLKGRLSELWFWDVILTANEADECLDGNGSPIHYTEHSRFDDLIHVWRFGDGPEDNSTTVFDQIGTNHLTIAGGARYVHA